MTLHSLTEYLRYRWKARGRHGVHSPFVYAFVENVLSNRNSIKPVTFPVPWADKPAPQYENIIRRMIAFYDCKSIINIARTGGRIPEGAQYDMIIADTSYRIERYASALKNDTVVILIAIHSSSIHSRAWDVSCRDTAVTLSIDLFGIGLLFFKKEFKEKQHFVLRWPLPSFPKKNRDWHPKER